MLAADYGNLGDLAITQAQVALLEEMYPQRLVIPVPISRTTVSVKTLRSELRPDDLVTMIGGGNTGDLYDDIQWLRELVVRSFPGQRIISFPQSIEFSDTSYGRWSRRRSQRVLERHGDLTLLVREEASYERARETFPGCAVELVPDVVLCLDRSRPVVERAGVIVSLRRDREALISPSRRSEVIAALAAVAAVRERDTHIGDVRLDQADADEALAAIWSDFRAAEVVVTDRLHGMIFAVITGTPCVVVDSATGKVGDFHRTWLSGVPSVRFLPDEPAMAGWLAELAQDIGHVEPASAPDGAFKARLVSVLRSADDG
ncbi:MAG: polysaccharide pyruvyl transferase family protein [Propionibacteriales bacterium]|nr:polysaccharide pyruvyl transferase family protein [Propionibacteriales bacterium]